MAQMMMMIHNTEGGRNVKLFVQAVGLVGSQSAIYRSKHAKVFNCASFSTSLVGTGLPERWLDCLQVKGRSAKAEKELTKNEWATFIWNLEIKIRDVVESKGRSLG